MKALIINLFALLAIGTSGCHAEMPDTIGQFTGKEKYVNEPDYSHVFFNPYQQAEYPGGMQNLMAFIASNLRYPQECLDQDIQGRVIVKFDVMEDGSIGDVRVVKSVHPLLDEEAVRVTKMMPKWQPAKNMGVVEKSYFNLPFTFKADEWRKAHAEEKE